MNQSTISAVRVGYKKLYHFNNIPVLQLSEISNNRKRFIEMPIKADHIQNLDTVYNTQKILISFIDHENQKQLFCTESKITCALIKIYEFGCFQTILYIESPHNDIQLSVDSSYDIMSCLRLNIPILCSEQLITNPPAIIDVLKSLPENHGFNII